MANEVAYPARYVLEDGSGYYLVEDSSGVLIKQIQDYGELVIQDGALCYFRFNETSGNFTDAIGSRVGVATNSTFTYAQTGALVGDSDTSVALSGTTPYITATGDAELAPPNHSNNLTIECWAQIDSVTSGSRGEITRLQSASGINYQISILHSGSNAQAFVVSDSTTGASSVDLINSQMSNTPVAGWFHFVVVYSGTNLTTVVYINSQRGFAPVTWGGTQIPIAWTDQALSIGNSPTGSRTLPAIDEFAIYPTALTVDQIARHYRAGVQYFDSGIGMAEPSQYPQLLAQ